MHIAMLLFKQIVIMFLLIAIGNVLYQKRIISYTGSKELGNLLIHIIIPCVIVNSYFSMNFSIEVLKGLVVVALLSLLALIIAIIVSYLLFGKSKGIENFSSAFSNAGFMGIPLVQGVLGSEAVFYVTIYVALLNVFQWTYGLLIVTRNRKYISIKKIITNPVIIALLIGIVGFMCPIRWPEVILKPIEYMSAMNTPVAMLLLGTYLGTTHFTLELKNKDTWKCVFSRLILVPFITLLILNFLPIGENMKTMQEIVVIAAMTPVGTNVAIFAQLFHADYEHAVAIVCISTILSIVTMPIILCVSNCLM